MRRDRPAAQWQVLHTRSVLMELNEL